MPIQIPLDRLLSQALRDAGIPIDGVNVGDPNNRATWHASYSTDATPAQRTQGNSILATIDPQDATTIASVKNVEAGALTGRDELFALGQALWEAIPAPTTTLAATRARFMQLLRNRL